MAITQKPSLEIGSVNKLLVSYALTTLIALLINSIYSITDGLFVSWGVGDNAMGGVSVVFPFVLIQGAISTALGGGAAAIISRRIGEKNIVEAAKICYNARVTFYITAITISIVGLIFCEQVLKLFGVTPEIYQYAKDYYTIILVGNIFSTGFSSIIRAEGKMIFALLIWVIPISINIILDAVFILGLNWGVKGAAYATIVCQICAFCMSILFFKRISMLRGQRSEMDKSRITQIFKIGLPSLIQSLALSASLLIINNFLKMSHGTVAIITFGYINKIIVMVSLPFLALSQAISPIIGYNFGAKNLDRVEKTFLYGIKLAVVYSFLAVIILELVPNYLIMIFTNNKEIIVLGEYALRIIAISIPFAPLAMLLGARYQSENKVANSIIMYSMNLLFLIVCLLVANGLGLYNAIWWIYVLASILTTLAAICIMTYSKIHSSKTVKRI